MRKFNGEVFIESVIFSFSGSIDDPNVQSSGVSLVISGVVNCESGRANLLVLNYLERDEQEHGLLPQKKTVIGSKKMHWVTQAKRIRTEQDLKKMLVFDRDNGKDFIWERE